MGDLLQFLTANPKIGITVAVSLGILVVALTLMFSIAFVQGREVSLWPPKLGQKPEIKKGPPQIIVEGRTTDTNLRSTLEAKSKFFEIRPNDNCYIVLNNNPRNQRSMTHEDVETLIEVVKIVHELGGKVDVAPFDKRPQGTGLMTEFCIGGPDSNARTKAHLRDHLRGLICYAYAPNDPNSLAFEFGTMKFRYEKDDYGNVKQAAAILAKFYNDDLSGSHPVFLICGQTSTTNKCAIAYLNQNYQKLANEFKNKPFCLIVKPRDYETYGHQDVIRVANLTSDIFPNNG